MLYYRSLLVIEVLGNEPYTDGLEGLSDAVVNGEFSGALIAESTSEHSGDEMAALLVSQGSDPEFLVREVEYNEEA